MAGNRSVWLMFLVVPVTLGRMDKRTPIEVGQLVKARRLELKLTQSAVVTAAGVDPKTYASLEDGSRWPQERTRLKVEEVLGWSPGSIGRALTGEDPAPINDGYRALTLRTREGRGIEAEMASAIGASLERARDDPKGEASNQAKLLRGVRSAWKLAPLASDLGANPADIKDFVQSSFGLLTGSGVLGLIAHDKELLGQVIQEFTRADDFGVHRTRRSVLHQQQLEADEGESANDMETATKSDAQETGDEGQEADLTQGLLDLAARTVDDEDKPS